MKRQIQSYISEEDYSKLKLIAEKEGLLFATLIRQILINYLKTKIMSYDENRISDLIDGGLHEQKQLHISGVSGSIKELNHYCRRRDCVFYNGISKRDNVMCSHKSPEIVSDKDGMRRCFSYCH